MPSTRRTTRQSKQNQHDASSQPPNVTQRSRRGQLAPHERVQIVELKAIGWTYSEINKRYPDIPIGTIKTTIARASKRGSAQNTLPRSGTPKKLDEADRLKLLQAISENPRVKSEALLALVNFKVCRTTVWRLLRSEKKRKGDHSQRAELAEEEA